MPAKYTRLDIDKCIFLFVNHEPGLINLVRDFQQHEFQRNVMALAKVAQYYKSPSVLTTLFDTGPNGPIVKEITDYLPDAPLIRRPGQINAMDIEDFVNEIKKTSRKQIVISLIGQGYDVFVVTDATGTFAEYTREAAHKHMVAAGCQLLNWAAVAGGLHSDWRRDIEGFGAIWTEHIPGYWCVMQSYQAAQKGTE
ncbi:isochorismatase family protein [Aspergillus eucalypticola CBS 122712]|uniref:Isochorismatase family protein n=1 Tax=Aspergillus eucalypticola (strain CBS 122712 / IBT 29274) TaxID=1448314 RepID=A0A317UVQ4_ASPEC|nr:isochorismatase family protein [Aspergillus eucalypticola CBS 122712]PWY65489.1 isochorismatase family protein [Aspergillus eucalypticola CBS 122712]